MGGSGTLGHWNIGRKHQQQFVPVSLPSAVCDETRRPRKAEQTRRPPETVAGKSAARCCSRNLRALSRSSRAVAVAAVAVQRGEAKHRMDDGGWSSRQRSFGANCGQ